MIDCSENLLETDNIMVDPYNISKISDKETGVYYQFKTEDNDVYIVYFLKRTEREYSIHFNVIGKKTDVIINKGKFYKIMSTVVNLCVSFILDNDLKSLTMFVEDDRRKAIFERYVDLYRPFRYNKTLFDKGLILIKY